jgi:hypothetical protein
MNLTLYAMSVLEFAYKMWSANYKIEWTLNLPSITGSFCQCRAKPCLRYPVWFEIVIRGKSYCSQEMDCKNEPNAPVWVTSVRNGIVCVGYTTNFQDSTTVKWFYVLWGGLTESPQFCQLNVHLQKYRRVNLFCYVPAEHRVQSESRILHYGFTWFDSCVTLV